MRWKQSLLSVFIATVSLAVGSAVASEEENVFNVGRKGTIAFDTEMKVGALTLAPGRYEFQHRLVDSEHIVRFTYVGTGAFVEGRTHVTRQPKQVVAEVQCTLEPLEAKASRTAVYSTGGYITKVEIKGEDALHRILEP